MKHFFDVLVIKTLNVIGYVCGQAEFPQERRRLVYTIITVGLSTFCNHHFCGGGDTPKEGAAHARQSDSTPNTNQTNYNDRHRVNIRTCDIISLILEFELVPIQDN